MIPASNKVEVVRRRRLRQDAAATATPVAGLPKVAWTHMMG